MSPLITEIIRHIFNTLGVGETSFGEAGITDSDFALNQTLSFQQESDFQATIYAAALPDTPLKLILADLADSDSSEFLLLFQFQEDPIHAFSIDYDSNQVKAKLFVKEIPRDLSLESLAQLLIGFEKIASLGMIWQKVSYSEVLPLIELAKTLL